MDTLNTQLKQKAVSLGLCDKWTKEWRNYDKEELMELFKKGMDFCIEHDFPSMDFINENFSPQELHDNGIWVNESLDNKTLSNGIYIALGDTTGTVRIGRWCAVTIYLRHESKLNIVAEEFSRVFVRLYDSAESVIIDSEDARISIFDRR